MVSTLRAPSDQRVGRSVEAVGEQERHTRSTGAPGARAMRRRPIEAAVGGLIRLPVVVGGGTGVAIARNREFGPRPDAALLQGPVVEPVRERDNGGSIAKDPGVTSVAPGGEAAAKISALADVCTDAAYGRTRSSDRSPAS